MNILRRTRNRLATVHHVAADFTCSSDYVLIFGMAGADLQLAPLNRRSMICFKYTGKEDFNPPFGT